MEERYIRVSILAFGYFVISKVLDFIGIGLLRQAMSAFLVLMLVYWIPSPLKADFVKWLKGSVVASLLMLIVTLLVVNLDEIRSLSLVLVLAFFIFWLCEHSE